MLKEKEMISIWSQVSSTSLSVTKLNVTHGASTQIYGIKLQITLKSHETLKDVFQI